ncbi:hypothetical protein [Myroides sp. WP-1]|uniref:hypothetical protein n=1 Tax=Myroides sp. WP-1 TaxID=2759944 RepID=UPI0015FA512F|nr:hypothetical protein [Myroides sp. WP-1]MBB1138396.1 hypothetical protein [Myroides sp. WP-1]
MKKRILDFFSIDISPKELNSELNTYVVEGKTQTRAGTLFIENEYTSLVRYKDENKGTQRIATYQVEDYKQSCSGFVFQLTERLNDITSDLIVRLNANYEVEEIVNHQAILAKWDVEKSKIKEQFSSIPDSEELFERFENALNNEEKLRQTLFYNGLTQLFFPRIKQMLEDIEVSKKYKRKRFLAGIPFGLQLPILEELRVQKIDDHQFSATIKGTLNKDEITDKKEFLSVFKFLYGEDKTLDDLHFRSKEYYVFDEHLIYQSGSIEEYFEVKGVHFKQDNRTFSKNGKR